MNTEQGQKGSLRKKGNKWYYRFYVLDERGKRSQKERVGTESREETEKLLEYAMKKYEKEVYAPEPEDISLGQCLDLWMWEELHPSSRSDGTLRSYQNIINRIKTFPIHRIMLQTLTVEDLQQFMDHLANHRRLAKGTRNIYCAVLRGALAYAVFPKKLLPTNPMSFVKNRCCLLDYDLFSQEEYQQTPKTISKQQYKDLIEDLQQHNPTAVLPLQIAYYTGLRLGEVCGLTWEDIDFPERTITIMRSICYCPQQKSLVLGPTKRKKIRLVYFGGELEKILATAQSAQQQIQNPYENICKIVPSGQRMIHQISSRNQEEPVETSQSKSPGNPEKSLGISYTEMYLQGNSPVNQEEIGESRVNFVCLREDGQIQKPETLSHALRRAKKRINGMEDFHFHLLRHNFTTRLLEFGAKPMDVQELLGHSQVATTLNVYSHSSEHRKREIVQSL